MRFRLVAAIAAVVLFGAVTPSLAQSPSPAPTATPTPSPTPPINTPPPGPTTARAYVNPDTGKPTANANVASTSSCTSPVTTDTQAVGKTDGTGNVHIDACLLNAAGVKMDTRATFDVSGVGLINACPDPDGAAAKTATLTDSNNDGVADRCTHSGFEADNQEYHLRVLSTVAGTQTVTFCADPDSNGCANETVKSTVLVTWTPVGGVGTGVVPDSNVARYAVAGLVALAGGLLLARRRAGAQQT